MSKAQAQKAREAAAGTKRKLSRAEQKQIAALIRQAKGDGKAHTAQQTIPYLQMYPDGICRITEKKYSKSVVFEDINYQLAQNEDKNASVENWCDFLNYFDSSSHFQLSFINHKSSMKEFENVIRIRPANDDFDEIRMEYAQMLRHQLAKGNNGLVKSKYITFPLRRIISGKLNQNWNVSSRIS